MRKAAGLILALAFLFQLAAFPCFGQEAQGVPSFVKSPKDIEKWLSGFTYQMQFPDVPKAIEDILDSKAGDCDDLAKVVSRALAGLGISKEIMVIKFKGTNFRHAICLWKTEGGNYNFFTNKPLVQTDAASVEAVAGSYFPNFESITPLNSGE
jgi:hypothetical protein